MYGMHAVEMLTDICTSAQMTGIHKLNSGLSCGVMGNKYIRRASAAPMTSMRGAKQATTTAFLENLTLRYATRLTDSMIKATSVVMSIMQ
jgi:hypothetical protein